MFSQNASKWELLSASKPKSRNENLGSRAREWVLWNFWENYEWLLFWYIPETSMIAGGPQNKLLYKEYDVGLVVSSGLEATVKQVQY